MALSIGLEFQRVAIVKSQSVHYGRWKLKELTIWPEPMYNRLLWLPLLRPLVQIIWRYTDKKDPWLKLEHKASHRLLGVGSVRNFRWYFEGKSVVEVTSVDEVCEWLLQCEYVHDPDLFHEADFWQHPRTFEQVRKGDCEDHALWTWRKLSELGLDAQFFCGQWICGEDDLTVTGHAWVVFWQDGIEYLLESVAKTKSHMVRPLEEVRQKYVPNFSVSQNFRVYIYSGLVKYLLAIAAKRKSRNVQGASLDTYEAPGCHEAKRRAARVEGPF